MALVGFRAAIGGYGGSGWQPIGQLTYYGLNFVTVHEDDAGRYDAANAVWRPVLVGETARRVTLGAQITVICGASCIPADNPVFSLKLQRNASLDIAAGQGQADVCKPGMANAQVTCTVLAQPGDFFNVIFYARCWTPNDPPIAFPSPWARNSIPNLGVDYCGVDNNQFHTYFWGTDYLP